MKDTIEINERIKILMHHYQYNATQFSKEIGETHNARIVAIIGMKRAPSTEIILKIKKRFPVNLNWLFGEDTTMLLESQEPEIESKETFSDIMKVLKEINRKLPDTDLGKNSR